MRRVRDHELVAQVLAAECDIASLTQDVDAKLRLVEAESIEGYVNESENLSSLGAQIRECDDVLESMEEMLGRFQGDLGSISSEIRHIQEQSSSLNVKLKNRRALHERLSVFAENIAIPPALIDTVLDAPVDEHFLPCLTLLHRKLTFVRTNEEAQRSQAYQEVAPELAKLESRAVSKVRACLFDQIAVLKRPKTNIQIIQQNKLLRLRGLVTFLKQHSKPSYDEVRQVRATHRALPLISPRCDCASPHLVTDAHTPPSPPLPPLPSRLPLASLPLSPLSPLSPSLSPSRSLSLCPCPYICIYLFISLSLSLSLPLSLSLSIYIYIQIDR